MIFIILPRRRAARARANWQNVDVRQRRPLSAASFDRLPPSPAPIARTRRASRLVDARQPPLTATHVAPALHHVRRGGGGLVLHTPRASVLVERLALGVDALAPPALAAAAAAAAARRPPLRRTVVLDAPPSRRGRCRWRTRPVSALMLSPAYVNSASGTRRSSPPSPGEAPVRLSIPSPYESLSESTWCECSAAPRTQPAKCMWRIHSACHPSSRKHSMLTGATDLQVEARREPPALAPTCPRAAAQHAERGEPPEARRRRTHECRCRSRGWGCGFGCTSCCRRARASPIRGPGR